MAFAPEGRQKWTNAAACVCVDVTRPMMTAVQWRVATAMFRMKYPLFSVCCGCGVVFL